jgi:hypothetical protein
MLKERKQTRVTMVVSKIDLISIDEKIKIQLSQQISKLCAEYEITVQTFFVSATTGVGIDQLKAHLHDLAVTRTEFQYIPKKFQEIEQRLKQNMNLPLIDSGSLQSDYNQFCPLEHSIQLGWEAGRLKRMYWNAYLEYQNKLGSILYDSSNNILCTDPSR